MVPFINNMSSVLISTIMPYNADKPFLVDKDSAIGYQLSTW